MNRRYPILLSALAVMTGLLSPLSARAQGDRAAPPSPFEPTITQKEADLLRRVIALAETNSATAVDLLEKQRSDRSSPALDFALGNLYLQSERYPDAEKSYAEALRKYPEFRRAKANLGRVYILQNQPAKVIPLYQSLVQNGQATADVLILLGHALLSMESSVSAENAYRQALLLQPNNRDALAGLTQCLLRQERFREGSALARELTALDPARPESWAIRANACLAQDQTTNAIVALESARRLGQITPDMLATLGDLYLNHEQPDDAAARYTEAFAGQAPSIPRILRAAEGFLMADQAPYAAPLLKRADSLAGQTKQQWLPRQRRDLLRLKGDLARLTGDIAAAMAAYQDLLKEDPLDGRVLITMGDLDRQQGKPEEAVMAYERAARLQGFEARAMVRHAQVEVERERYKRAVELLETAQAFDRQTHVARYLEQVRRLAEFSESRGITP